MADEKFELMPAEKLSTIVSETIEAVKRQICDDYCKYPAEYSGENEQMLEEQCEDCPLNRL